MEVKNDSYWYLIYSEAQKQKTAQAYSYLAEQGFKPILIKGWAAARKYPNFERQSVDVDLCVIPSDFKNAKKLLLTEEGKKFNIDLHKGLRHFDKLSWENIFENSELIEINNVMVRIPREEDHLRILCVHWLTDGGAFKERLWDIYYAIEFRSENFDWHRFLEISGKKRKKWLICCLAATEKYLGLSLVDTPVADEIKDIPEWFYKSIEKEWKDSVKLKPLIFSMGNRKLFREQIKKRFPPNAIQATVDLEGNFDNKPRIFYQFGDIFYRIYTSLNRYYTNKFQN